MKWLWLFKNCSDKKKVKTQAGFGITNTFAEDSMHKLKPAEIPAGTAEENKRSREPASFTMPKLMG